MKNVQHKFNIIILNIIYVLETSNLNPDPIALPHLLLPLAFLAQVNAQLS